MSFVTILDCDRHSPGHRVNPVSSDIKEYLNQNSLRTITGFKRLGGKHLSYLYCQFTINLQCEHYDPNMKMILKIAITWKYSDRSIWQISNTVPVTNTGIWCLKFTWCSGSSRISQSEQSLKCQWDLVETALK